METKILNEQEENNFKLWWKAYLLMRNYNRKYVEYHKDVNNKEAYFKLQLGNNFFSINNINETLINDKPKNFKITTLLNQFKGLSETVVKQNILDFETFVKNEEIISGLKYNETGLSLLQ